jgi:hypothetical protein
MILMMRHLMILHRWLTMKLIHRSELMLYREPMLLNRELIFHREPESVLKESPILMLLREPTMRILRS